MEQPTKITWDDISTAADSMFNVWVGHPELNWAKAAWKILETKGLTSYSNEIDKTWVHVRLMTLGTIYKEFCCQAFEECIEPDYYDWTEELQISPLRIGQLTGPEYDPETEEDHDLVEQAVKELVNNARRDVCKALKEGFGSDSMLFASLWMSPELDAEFIEPDKVTLDEILNHDLVEGKHIAFGWIDAGMPSLW